MILKWCKDGIYVLKGPLTGQNLNTLDKYEVVEWLQSLLETDLDTKNKQAIKEAIEDLSTI